jgi:hypothetical protein
MLRLLLFVTILTEMVKAFFDGDAEGEANLTSVGDSEGEAKQACVGDDEGKAKQASVAQSLKYYNEEDYIDNVDVDSNVEFCSSFPRDCNSKNFIFWWTSKN